MLNRVDQVTDLGVLFDNRLFANHIRLLAQKAYRSLGYITRFSQGFACDVFVVLYCTFVRSTIEYASQVWSPQSLTHIATIEDVQKKFLRTCSFRMKVPLVDGHTNYNLILSRLNLTSLESRRSVNDLSFLYKLLRGDVDCSFLLGRLNFRIGHRTRLLGLLIYSILNTTEQTTVCLVLLSVCKIILIGLIYLLTTLVVILALRKLLKVFVNDTCFVSCAYFCDIYVFYIYVFIFMFVFIFIFL